jgi:3'-phosphoadenosine 5'-phosphosulfate (PAPS) 3'-phosphatase
MYVKKKSSKQRNSPHSPFSMTQSNGSTPLRLRELLAACVSAGWLAGEVIREVVAENVDLAMVNKDANKYDPQTVADRRSQQRIIYALRTLWPQLQIVGEEGELDAPAPIDAVQPDVQGFLADLPTELASHRDVLDKELDPQHLVMWIDPLDGTKKFAEKKYDEVSVLLGIAYHQRPIAGVMHLPFHGDGNGETLWGTCEYHDAPSSRLLIT